MSIESLLSRLTPKSHGYEPTIPGARPEITREDVLQALSTGKRDNSYALISAKYLGDQQSLDRCERWLAHRVWRDFYPFALRYAPKQNLAPATAQLMGPVIMALYITPVRRDGKPWTDEDVAKALDMHVNTYRKKYRDFVNRCVTRLQAEERSTLRSMRIRLREEP